MQQVPSHPSGEAQKFLVSDLHWPPLCSNF
jgi:hypothetical protein